MYHIDTSIDAILQQVHQLKIREGESAMLLFGEASQVDIPQLIERLTQEGISFFGGLFPGIIHGTQNHNAGYLLQKLQLAHPPIVVKNIDKDVIELPDIPTRTDAKNTVLTFVDGLTANISGYLQQLYHHFGDSANFLGGGAGSLSLVQQACVFTAEGFFQDAAIVCLLDLHVSLGVRHGWKQLAGPIVATRTSKNTIYELNWTNAFEVYRETVEADAGQQFTDENFFDIAKGYPFGIFKEIGEDIVRDPIAVGKNGELICVGEVPENTVLYILKGENQTLIHSAGQATASCLDKAANDIQHIFVVDCISRTLFLEDEFNQELQAIHRLLPNSQTENRLQGVLSLGEISSDGDGFLEFFNKTLVVGALY